MSQSPPLAQTINEPVADRPRLSRFHVVLTLGMMVLAVFATQDAWLDILRIVQRDEEASHIILVPLVFAWIAWGRRGELSGWRPRATYWGAAIALAGVGLWLFGYIKAMQVIWHFGAVVTLFGAFVSVNGLSIVRRLWPAFLVLVFLMPLPGIIRHPLALFLQNASAQATEVVIVALGFNLTRHSNLLIINDHAIGIAEACNGMRMVSMLILIVFAFVFSEKIRPWVRVVLILAAAPIAVMCNIIRLVPTVLAYGYFSPNFADQMHEWLGWGLAFASYFGLMGLLWLMRWMLLPVDQVDKRGQRRLPKRHRVPPDRPDRDEHRSGLRLGHLTGAMLGVVVVLGSAFAINQSLPDGANAEAYHERIRAVAQDLPRQAGSWSAVDAEVPQAAVALLRPNVLISRRYIAESAGSFAMLVVQCEDARDMEGHYPPNCYPSSGWTGLGQQSAMLQIGELQAQAIDYEYERMTNDGLDTINVINLIVIPGDGFTNSMRSIRSLAGTVSDRFYGAAQVQFVFAQGWNRQERLEAVQQVGTTLEPLIRVILDKMDKEVD